MLYLFSTLALLFILYYVSSLLYSIYSLLCLFSNLFFLYLFSTLYILYCLNILLSSRSNGHISFHTLRVTTTHYHLYTLAHNLTSLFYDPSWTLNLSSSHKSLMDSLLLIPCGSYLSS